MAADGGRSKRSGSGFISRNNDDPTAAAIFDFMQKAGIPRKLTIIWNFIPWWNGTRKVTKKERYDGAQSTGELIDLLRPNLLAVVMVGREAAKAKRYLENTGLKLLCASDHPGPLVKARWPDRWKAIPLKWAKVWAKVRRLLNGSETE